MNSNDTQVNQLVLNLIESRANFDTMKSNGLSANELYLVSDDNKFPVTAINYVSTDTPKFNYETEDGTVTDIITIDNLKSALNLSSVASDGQYTSLSSKPQINGIELTGNKSTSELGITLNYSSDSITNKPSINNMTLTGNQTTKTLGIQYSDLKGLPTIPTVTSDYVNGNMSAALTSAGVDEALENYVPKNRSVTGSGALSGGGQLTDNISITHASAPTGLTTSAVKVGVDKYGHVCVGSGITAEDVNAVPIKYNIATSVASLDGSNAIIIVNCMQDETFAFTTVPTIGRMTTIYCINASQNSITLTISQTLANSVFVNGSLLSSDYLVSIDTQKCKRFDAVIIPMNQTTFVAFINIF